MQDRVVEWNTSNRGLPISSISPLNKDLSHAYTKYSENTKNVV